MNLEVNAGERDLLQGLLESRISDLHPEIRRSMNHAYHDKLAEELKCCESLLERMKSLENASG